MNNELKDTKDFLQTISDTLHFWLRDNFPDSWVLLSQIVFKFLLLIGLIYAIDFMVKLFLEWNFQDLF